MTNNKTTSKKVTIASILTLILISVLLYEGVRQLVIRLTDNPVGLFPALIIGMASIWILHQPIINIFKKLFKDID